MNIEELRNYCLSFKGANEKMPFDDKTLVFYVIDKMFCLTNIELFEAINLKCDPVKAIELREEYSEVTSGYHMNKKHWNTIKMNGKITNTQLKGWISDSYHLVVKGLSKKSKDKLETT